MRSYRSGPVINGKRVDEHRLIAERALGRPLPPGAIVHHVDEDPSNNRNDNLVICQDRDYHTLLHVRLRILQAGGDPNTDRICPDCGPVPKENFGNGAVVYCRRCHNVRQNAKNRRKSQMLAEFRSYRGSY